jgi:hypothetical protein
MLRWTMGLFAITFALLASLSSLLAGAQPMRGGGGLTGSWNISITPDDANQAGAKPFDEVITFKGDQISAKTLGDRGFKPVHYEEDSRPGGAEQFTATQSNEKDGSKAAWTGNVAATAMEGTLVITKKDGTTISYTFRGNRSDQ